MKTKTASVTHVAWLIGIMTLLFVTVLSLANIFTSIDDIASSWLHLLGEKNKNAEPWLVIIITACASFFPPLAMLHTPSIWRRNLLWFTTFIITAAWQPVLGLAGLTLPIAAPIAACLWSGVCAVIYASRHALPVDHATPAVREVSVATKSPKS